MPYPIYTISTDTADGKLNGTLLGEQIVGAALPAADNVSRVGDILTITGTYTTPQKTTIDGLVAAHVGARDTTENLLDLTVIMDEVTITQDATWQVLGRAVFSAAALGELADLKIRATGAVKSTGAGAQLRLVEVKVNATRNTISSNNAVGNTGGSWEHQSFRSNVALTEARNKYVIEGRRNGASAASVEAWHLSLRKVVPL